MTSAVPHVISSDGLVKFRLYYFVRKWGKEVIFHIFSCCFLEGSSKLIGDILKENGILLDKKRGKDNPFDKSESQKISSGPPGSLDITALSKICQTLWEKGVNDPGDKLKKVIKKIKDERNNVSHEESNISQSELGIKLQEFGRTLEEALDEAALRYSCHSAQFNQWKIDIGEEIPKIQEKIREKYDPSKTEDRDRLQAEIEEHGGELREYIRERSKEELKPLYETLCQFMPFSWLCRYGITDPCKIIVSLKMDKDKNFHGGHSNQEFNTFDQNEVLSKKDLLGNDPEVVIISGNCGSGKTTLLCSIIEKWFKNETDDFPNLSSYQVLLYMQFRNDDHDNFDKFLQSCLYHVVTDLNFDLVKSSLLRLRCLILCDGFDEKNVRSSKLFEEILRLRLKCKNMKIVVTTRPVNTEELTHIVNNANLQRMNLSVVGLQMDEIKKLVKKLTPYLVQNATDRDIIERELIKAFESMSPGVQIILKNPLQLSLFVLLFIECPHLQGSIRSVSKLYIELWKQNSERLRKKLGLKDAGKTNELEQFYRQNALKFHLQKRFEIKQEDTLDFQDKCDELDLSFESVMSTYFNIKHSVKDLNPVKIYCYRHRTEQEFSAAGAICDMILKLHKEKRLEAIQLKKEMKAILATQSEVEASRVGTNTFDFSKELREIVKFVVGIMYNTEKGILQQVIHDILSMVNLKQIQIYAMDDMLMFLREANNDPMVIGAIAKRIKDACGQRRPILSLLKSSNDFSGVPELLSIIKPEWLKIVCNDEANPNDIPDLIQGFEVAVRNDVKLNLKLDMKSEYNSSRYSDRYLELGKTCVIFYGILSANGISLIPTCIKKLLLQLDIKMLDMLSRRLPELQQLSMLHLHLHDDGSVDTHGLSLLHYPGGDFKVHYKSTVNLDVKSTVERIANVLNSLWPPQRREASLTALDIVNVPALSRDAATQLKESLEFPNLDELVISYEEDDQIERIHVFDGALQKMIKGFPFLHNIDFSSLADDKQQMWKGVFVKISRTCNDFDFITRAANDDDFTTKAFVSLSREIWMTIEKEFPLQIEECSSFLDKIIGGHEGVFSSFKDYCNMLRIKPVPESGDSDKEVLEWRSTIHDFGVDVNAMADIPFIGNVIKTLHEDFILEAGGLSVCTDIMSKLRKNCPYLYMLDNSSLKAVLEGCFPGSVAKKKSKEYEELDLD